MCVLLDLLCPVDAVMHTHSECIGFSHSLVWKEWSVSDGIGKGAQDPWALLTAWSHLYYQLLCSSARIYNWPFWIYILIFLYFFLKNLKNMILL